MNIYLFKTTQSKIIPHNIFNTILIQTLYIKIISDKEYSLLKSPIET